MIDLQVLQSPLFIFFLSLISGIIGYNLKYYKDRIESKRLKVIKFNLNISTPCVKALNVNGYLPPTLSIQLENLSKTDIKINSVLLKNRKQLDIFPAECVRISETDLIKQYEIKSFLYQFQIDNLIRNKNTFEILKIIKRKIEIPQDFFEVLDSYFFKSENSIEWKKFERNVSNLQIIINTNIGIYKKRISKQELKMIKKMLFTEFKKKYND